MTAFPHLLERTVDIGATVDTVFEYFTDSALWAAWWGAGSDASTRGPADGCSSATTTASR